MTMPEGNGMSGSNSVEQNYNVSVQCLSLGNISWQSDGQK
jgi:hypothetical protein